MTSFDYGYELGEELGLGLISGMLSSIPSMLFSIVIYVLTAVALYTIAKRRGLNKPWLAWIPVLNCWILGSLSDQYRYVVKGENKSKRKVLLTLNILTMILSIAIIVCCVVMIVQVVSGAINEVNEEQLLEMILGPTFGMVGLCLPMVGIAIAYAIVYYMALYDVYKSLDPSNCVLFLVLSILFGITEPFFLFFNRNKDLGMPPRRHFMPAHEAQTWQPQQAAGQPQWQPQQPQNPQGWQPNPPAQEPWESENKDYL